MCILAVFVGNLSSTKLESLKFFETITMHIGLVKMILKNKTVIILDFDSLRKLHPWKICIYTIYFIGLNDHAIHL